MATRRLSAGWIPGNPWALLLAGALLLSLDPRPAAADHLPAGFGPMPARNFQPFQMLTLGLFADRARVIPRGALDLRLELAETSSIFHEVTNPPAFRMVRNTVKFETLRSALFFRYGLTDRLELGAEVPVLYRYAGFMEGLITATERATTGLNSARRLLQDSGYAYTVQRDGVTLFEGGDGALGLGDITFLAKYLLVTPQPGRPAVALRLAVKAPTGDPARTFGSGHPDLGVGLAAEHAIGRQWMVYANVSAVYPTGEVRGLDLEPTYSGMAAVEYLWSADFSLVAQFDYWSTPYRSTGIKALDRGVTESVVGFNYRLRPDLLWQVYGVENLDFVTGSAADFTLSTTLTYRFR